MFSFSPLLLCPSGHPLRIVDNGALVHRPLRKKFRLLPTSRFLLIATRCWRCSIGSSLMFRPLDTLHRPFQLHPSPPLTLSQFEKSFWTRRFAQEVRKGSREVFVLNFQTCIIVTYSSIFFQSPPPYLD